MKTYLGNGNPFVDPCEVIIVGRELVETTVSKMEIVERFRQSAIIVENTIYKREKRAEVIYLNDRIIKALEMVPAGKVERDFGDLYELTYPSYNLYTATMSRIKILHIDGDSTYLRFCMQTEQLSDLFLSAANGNLFI